MEAKNAMLIDDFICNNGPQYIVPVYQRNYTWQEKNVDRFLDDVKRILLGEIKTHYIGNIVYLRKSEDTYHEREIVDGQQRLTTVFLSLYALRDIANEKGDTDTADDITTLYLENKTSAKSRAFNNKLKPNIGDGNTMLKIVTADKEGLVGNTTQLYKNYLLIRNKFEDWMQLQKASGETTYTVDDITSALKGLSIVWVALQTGDEPQQIFESINSTGEPLTASDLIKNYLLIDKTDSEQTNLYEIYWRVIEKNICPETGDILASVVSKKLAEFFRYYLSAKLKKLVDIEDIYLIFKDNWVKWVHENSSKYCIEELRAYSRYWNELYIKQTSSENLRVLRAIESKMPVPFLLGCCYLADKHVIAWEQVDEVIKLINCYMMRRSLIKIPTSGISRFFPTLLRSVIDTCNSIGYKDFTEVVKFYIVNSNVNTSMYMPDDDSIRNYLRDENAYVIKQVKTAFDLLETKDNPVAIDTAKLTVEHVLPQKATKYWITKVDNEEKYPKYCNLIGNLTLADKSTNSKMSNKDFANKVIALKKVGHINMNVQILEKTDWNYLEILNRTEMLIDKLIELFPYFKSDLELLEPTVNESYDITLISKECEAKAIMYSDGSVEVLSGSHARDTDNRNEILENELLARLADGGIEKKDGYYELCESMQFKSISGATCFILGGSHNGWEYWSDDSGNVIKNTIRKYIQ